MMAHERISDDLEELERIAAMLRRRVKEKHREVDDLERKLALVEEKIRALEAR